MYRETIRQETMLYLASLKHAPAALLTLAGMTICLLSTFLFAGVI